MNQEPKKISFGFSKSTKKVNIISKQPVEEKKVELIDCLEGHSIKLKNVVEEVEQPLVIPINDSAKNLLDRVKDSKIKKVDLPREHSVEGRLDSELTPDELAARELIRESQNYKASDNSNVALILPVGDDKVEFEGKAESTLDDYENIPISKFGLAMLRGMGWNAGTGIGKNQKVIKTTAPALRPKGMGLGANKIANQDQKNKVSVDKDGKELILKVGAHAKIISGRNKGDYCDVQGLDDEGGRVIVKTTVKGLILSLNEFLVIPVTNEEYAKSSKVINNAKYEAYKEKSDRKLEEARMENGVANNHNDEKHKQNQKPQIKEETSHEREQSDPNVFENKTKKERNHTEGDKRNRIKKEAPEEYYSSHAQTSSQSGSRGRDYVSSKESQHRERRRSCSPKRYKKRESKKYRNSLRSSSESKDRDEKYKINRDKNVPDDSDSDCKYEKKRRSKKEGRSKKKYRDSSSSSDDAKFRRDINRKHKHSKSKDRHGR